LATYGTATDLFSSGHTAIAVYGCPELTHWGGPGAIVAVAIEVSAVLVLRAYYTMGVFAGIIMALWSGASPSRSEGSWTPSWRDSLQQMPARSSRPLKPKSGPSNI
jgi:hypothetical protein